MANTALTLEDMLAFESRLKKFIEGHFREVQENPQPLFYTVAEVARMTSLCGQTIRQKLKNPNEKHLKGVQPDGVQGTWLIPKESLDAYLSSLKPKR